MSGDQQRDAYQMFLEGQTQRWSVLDRIRAARHPSLRLQFCLKALLWLTALAAAFFAGTVFQRERDRPTYGEPALMPRNVYYFDPNTYLETMQMPDGTSWFRYTKDFQALDGQPTDRD